MRHLLYCSRSPAENKAAMVQAVQDGLRVNMSRQTATLEALGIEIVFRSFEHPHDAERLAGLELAGVVGLWVVDARTRDVILSRIRP